MFRLISMGIEVVSSVIFIVPAVLVLQYAVFKQRSISKTAAAMFFGFYLTAVFSVTGIPTVTSWHINPEFNLIPFIDIVNSPLDYIRNTAGSVLGYCAAKQFSFRLPWKLAGNDDGSYQKYELSVIFAAVFVTSVCFKPLVLNMLWDEVLVSLLWERIR